MRSQKYLDYIASQEWHDLKRLVRVRALGRCEILYCRNPADDVHHLTYQHLGHEDLDELLAVCRPHHTQLHQYLQRATILFPSRSMVTRPTVKAQLDLFAHVANDNQPVSLMKQR